jgi:allantoin racemase
VSVSTITYGPASIECRRDVTLATPAVIADVIAAENAGADAVVVDCMLDPGVHAAREVVAIPTVGPGESAMRLAATLGPRFSILSVLDSAETLFRDRARRFGVDHRLASVRSMDIPVLELDDDLERTLAAAIDTAEHCVRRDGAHVLVPGCTGLAGKATLIQRGLADRGITAVVVDPPSAATRALEVMLAMGLVPSLRTYPRRAPKTRVWPGDALVTTSA